MNGTGKESVQETPKPCPCCPKCKADAEAKAKENPKRKFMRADD